MFSFKIQCLQQEAKTKKRAGGIGFFFLKNMWGGAGNLIDKGLKKKKVEDGYVSFQEDNEGTSCRAAKTNCC